MLRISETGIRDGEIITGCQKQSNGIIMEIRGFYPPQNIPSDQEIIEKLSHIYFFKYLTPKERKEWLVENRVHSEVYLDDIDLEVRFLKIEGPNFFTEQIPQHIDTLLEDRFWPIKEVYNLFKRKPGRKGTKTTLVFRPSNWIVESNPYIVENYTGECYDFDTENIEIVSGEQVYFVDGIALRGATYDYPPLSENILKKFNFTPGIYKSLLQKLIRTGCKFVEIPTAESGSIKLHADHVFRFAFWNLFFHPGSFVPNIQKFVSGLEALTKRLAVIIFEDSYSPDAKCLTFLLAASMYSRINKSWKPKRELAEKWLNMGLASMREKRVFCREDGNHKTENKIWHTRSHQLLSLLKSFQSDIDMVEEIANNGGVSKEGYRGEIEMMPLIHAFDQHCSPELAYFFDVPDKFLRSISFVSIFDKVWNDSSKVNPRRGYTFGKKIENIRKAQGRLFYVKYFPKTFRKGKVDGGKREISFTLPDAFLAGMLGQKETIKAYVVMNPEDIRTFIAVRKPTRGKSDDLTEDEKEGAIRTMKYYLSEGIKLKVPESIPDLQGAILFLKGGNYYIGIDEEIYDWNDIRTLSYTLDILEPLEKTLDSAIKFSGEGIEEGDIRNIIGDISQDVYERLIFYLDGFTSQINLSKISRDGSGVSYTVTPLDIEVVKILSKVCVFCPSTLEITSTGFKVKNGPLFWSLRDRFIRGRGYIFDNTWPLPKNSHRELWQHQVDAIESMIGKSRRSYLIWIPPGLGKTLICLRYITYLIREKIMSKYFIYTLPPSATDAVMNEMRLEGFKCNLLDGRRTGKVKEILPGVINIIYHDHMRLLEKEIKEVIGESLLVIDEFHKTMAKTIRTSIALEIAKACSKFIGMSGTIIRDDNHKDLIRWLEQVSDFEVTEQNYWVSVSSLISRKVTTGIEIIREDQIVEMGEEYFKVVPPGLGGTSQSLNFRLALNMSYERVERAMVERVYDFYQEGEGVFLIASSVAKQNWFYQTLVEMGVDEEAIFLYTNDAQITLKSNYKGPIKIVITTKKHSEGYTLTKFRIMITSVYLTNQATREQLEKRLNRIGQQSSYIRIITYLAGVLTHIHENYEKTRSVAEAFAGFAKNIEFL